MGRQTKRKSMVKTAAPSTEHDHTYYSYSLKWEQFKESMCLRVPKSIGASSEYEIASSMVVVDCMRWARSEDGVALDLLAQWSVRQTVNIWITRECIDSGLFWCILEEIRSSYGYAMGG
jgi:hypothetical protein